MSATTDLLLARLQRLAATYKPAMAGKILRAYEIMRTSMTDGEIAALLKSGASAERVAAALTHEPWFGQALTGVGTGAQDITLRSARQYAAELPRDAREAVKLGIDLSNPRIAAAMVTMKSRATDQLTKDAAATMRQVVKTGMEAGKGSKAIARTLRDSIGLAPNQEQACRNFEKMLRDGDRAALTRALRDKRYDGTLNRLMGKDGKGLTEKQITTMADAYRRKMVAFNANTQARTLANDAQRAGQRLAWEDAIGKGVVDRANLWKQRVSLRDGKVRDEHIAWDGEVRRFDEPYSSGEMVVGELEWGCRCMDVYFEDESGERFGAGQGPRPVDATQAPIPPMSAAAPTAPPMEWSQAENEALEKAIEGQSSSSAAKQDIATALGERVGMMTPQQQRDVLSAAGGADTNLYEILNGTGGAQLADLKFRWLGQGGTAGYGYDFDAWKADLAARFSPGIPAGQRAAIGSIADMQATVIRQMAAQGRAINPADVMEEVFKRLTPMEAGAIREQAAAKLVETWAESSDGFTPLSNAMQRAVQEAFGLSDETLSTFLDMKLTDPDKYQRWLEGVKWYEAHADGLKAFSRAMYDDTQAWFKTQGVTHVNVWRGAELGQTNAVETVRIGLRPASSFSTTFDTARNFSGQDGTLVGMRIPVDQVLGTARSGWGCLNEREVVVLGSVRGPAVMFHVSQIDTEFYKRAVAKGAAYSNLGARNAADAIVREWADKKFGAGMVKAWAAGKYAIGGIDLRMKALWLMEQMGAKIG